jgi:DGQHR domain-containing protein
MEIVEMPNQTISIRCLEITQPIGTFYIGVMDAEDLVRISYADVRRIAERDIEKYLGIERPLSHKRVKELKSYITTIDATFPTGVILAISSEHASYDPQTGIMRIDDDDRVAKIIDGQHRIAGLEDLAGETFQINVVLFIDMDIEDQAMVFSTINLAQTKVSKSLVYDLYEYTKTRSPTKTCHNIARLLNSRQGSPFYGRIKILGTATRPHQPLTQAAFVEALLRVISGDTQKALLERDYIKRGRKLERTPSTETQLVLRNMFIDERDAEIAKVIWNYFSAVEERWPNAWRGVDMRGNMLPRTNGFRALMRFFPLVYLRVGGPGSVPSQPKFLSVFRNVPLKDDDFNTERYPPGTGGESQLFRDLESHLSRMEASNS